MDNITQTRIIISAVLWFHSIIYQYALFTSFYIFLILFQTSREIFFKRFRVYVFTLDFSYVFLCYHICSSDALFKVAMENVKVSYAKTDILPLNVQILLLELLCNCAHDWTDINSFFLLHIMIAVPQGRKFVLSETLLCLTFNNHHVLVVLDIFFAYSFFSYEY